MVRTVTFRAAASLLALWAIGSPGRAECVFPEGTRESPREAAGVLLESTDRVGFAVIRREEDRTNEVAEEIEILFAFKGLAGPVQMNMPVQQGIFWATANATSFHAPEGTLVFAALNETNSGAVISECTQQLFIRPGQDRIIAALFDMSRQGALTAAH